MSKRYFYAVAFLMCLVADAAFGQSPTGTATVVKAGAAGGADAIVVTATRHPRPVGSVPGIVYLLDAAEQTLKNGVRTTPDMLEGIPSVLVQKTGYGQGSPYLRGFTGFRTLCLIDGIRLNNSVFRDGPNQYWNTVDPFSLAGYELLMGPASVLYGSDAVGGTLNALPSMPPEFEGEPVWRKTIAYRGSTAESSSSGRLEISGRPSEKFGVVLGGSLKAFGDLRGGAEVGKQEHTGYDEMDYDLRADYHFDKRTTLSLGHQTVEQDDAWRTHKTIYGIDWEGLAVGNEKQRSLDQHRDLTYLKLVSTGVALADRVECSVSRHFQKEDEYRVRADGRSDLQGFGVETFGGSAQLESDTGIGRLVYGAEYYRDVVASHAFKYKADGSFDKEEIQGPVADDATYDSVGVYAQHILETFGGSLDVIPGVRYTYSRADAREVKNPETGGQMSVEGQWDAFVGSVRMLHPLVPDRSASLFAGVSQGFRAPNLSDLTRLDTARSNEIETPSPDLRPERYVNCEAGIKSRTGRMHCQLCCYYTWIDDMIVRTPTGRTIDESIEVTKRNSGAGYVQGAELSARYEVSSQWAVWFSGSLMEGKVDTYPTSEAELARDYISRLMPPTGEMGVRWQSRNSRCWCEVIGNAAAKADKLSGDDIRDTQRIPPGGTPAYAIMDVRAGMRVTGNLDLSLTVANVFDDDYRIHGSGVNEPGRNLIVSAVCVF